MSPIGKLRRVLVVEDEWLIADQVQEILEEAGFVVVGPVPSVTKALALLAYEPVDGAVLDISLSGEKSYPIAADLLKRRTPFLFLSSHVAADIPANLRSSIVLQKPILAATLVNRVSSFWAT